MLVKKEIKINSRKNLAVFKAHLQRKREETRENAVDHWRDMRDYWTVTRILREVTRTAYLPMLAEGLFGAVLAYTTKSYKNTSFIKSAITGISGLFRKSKAENDDAPTPHTDL